MSKDINRIDRFFHRVQRLWELSLSLTRARFILRHEGSLLGIFWYLLNPLAMFLILLFLKGFIHKSATEYYSVYLFLGLIMFNLFGQATTVSISSLTSHRGVIRSLKIEHEPFVISGVLQSVFSHLFEVAILAGLLVYFKIPLLGLLFYPVILFFLVVFITGCSFILAAIGAYVSDLANIWRILVQLAWFTAPIFYAIPKSHLLFLNRINPMLYFMDNAREIIIYGRIPKAEWLFVMCGCSLFFLIGIVVFEKYKNKFAEVI